MLDKNIGNVVSPVQNAVLELGELNKLRLKNKRNLHKAVKLHKAVETAFPQFAINIKQILKNQKTVSLKKENLEKLLLIESLKRVEESYGLTTPTERQITNTLNTI